MAAEVTPTTPRSTPKSTRSASPRSSAARATLDAAPGTALAVAQTIDSQAANSQAANSQAVNSQAANAPSANVPPMPRITPQDSVDFLLHPAELAKGRRAAENYLSTFRTEESRRAAEEMLETLATVISGGKCDSVDFPWQQIRPYHGAAALTMLKERGAPARIETLRCRKNSSRSFRAVPTSYPPREVQKIRSTLTRVIEECGQLGFLAGEGVRPEPNGAVAAKSRTRPTARHRLLGDGELRALIAASASDGTAQGCRDAVFFALVYRGLRIAEIVGLTLASVRFNNKSAACTISASAGTGQTGSRGRKVELTNDELIRLEDWLDHRGDGPGPLLGAFGKNGKQDGKRLTTALMAQICDERGRQAEVAPFSPTDLSRSADALFEHRKQNRRTPARESADFHSAAERILFEREVSPTLESEMIRFPFLGLGI